MLIPKPSRRAACALAARIALLALAVPLGACAGVGGPQQLSSPAPEATRVYPVHTNVVATTFWVGEILDPNADDGSQVVSTYDDQWLAHYGGCDGVRNAGKCETETRTSDNDYFPQTMKPLENPFYLDLPFDDINNQDAFSQRGNVIPWANDPGYLGLSKDTNISFMKNRWVRISRGSNVCYGQIEDAGPAEYNDSAYVFGSDDARPRSKKFNGAGMDVSPALNGCLGFTQLDGTKDRVNWQFVEEGAVPEGPWKKIVTTRPTA